MRLSMCLSLDTPGAQSLLRSFDASALANLSTGLITLPSWLTIACATTGRTTQTSASTIVSGLGANAARARNVGSGTGLAVEMARTNFCRRSNDLSHASWGILGGTVVTANQGASPDGTNIADKLDLSGGGSGLYSTSIALAGAVTNSVWLKQFSGAASLDFSDSQVGTDLTNIVLGAAWARSSKTFAAAPANDGPYFVRAASGGGNHLALVSWCQTENASYPSSALGNAADLSTTRAQDLLTATPSSVAPGGRFNLDFTFAPNYTHGEFAADHNLVYFDANNRIYIKQSDKTLRLRLGGSDTASGALTWAREDAIRVVAQHRVGGKRLTVYKNNVSVYDSTLLGAASAISLPGSVGILGDGTTTPESADLRALTVYRP